MNLFSIHIEGFRRHLGTEVFLSDATFLLGENNIGKSSILCALNYLLNDVKKIPEEEFFCILDSEGNCNIRVVDKIVLTAEFRNVPDFAKEWVGFKGRILKYEVPYGVEETGNRVIYRKTFEPGKDCVVEMKEFKRNPNPIFSTCKTLNDYLNNGLIERVLPESLKTIDKDKALTKPQLQLLESLDELYIFDENEETWFKNPGGIPGNVLIRLPKFLLIPAQDKIDELSGTSGTLLKTLNELFNEVRETSENFQKAQEYLNLLSKELDPSDDNSEIGKMISDLNGIMSDVFPNTGVCAQANLEDANKVIKPQFKVSMFSNITSSVSLQGTGLIRSAVFALLRYKNMRDNRLYLSSSTQVRPLIIGFEEPEIYLHPNAACKMRDTIYELASSEHNQIICTTHSPYMIDLSRKPSQILNNLCVSNSGLDYNGNIYSINKISAFPFNTSAAFKSLQDDDKQYVKMLLKVDDSIGKVFFVNNTLIVEGDTEDIVLKETINRMPEKVRNDILSNWQIVKARGKAAIVSLVKYLRSMGIQPYVIHDEDSDVPHAAVFNLPIAEALGGETKRIMLHNCIEDVLGYNPPDSEKPYKAYKFIEEHWNEDWLSVSEPWRQTMEKVFVKSFELINVQDRLQL